LGQLPSDYWSGPILSFFMLVDWLGFWHLENAGHIPTRGTGSGSNFRVAVWEESPLSR
jgi:hypothetical protein